MFKAGLVMFKIDKFAVTISLKETMGEHVMGNKDHSKSTQFDMKDLPTRECVEDRFQKISGE